MYAVTYSMNNYMSWEDIIRRDLKELNLNDNITYNRLEWKRRIHVADPIWWDYCKDDDDDDDDDKDDELLWSTYAGVTQCDDSKILKRKDTCALGYIIKI